MKTINLSKNFENRCRQRHSIQLLTLLALVALGLLCWPIQSADAALRQCVCHTPPKCDFDVCSAGFDEGHLNHGDPTGRCNHCGNGVRECCIEVILEGCETPDISTICCNLDTDPATDPNHCDNQPDIAAECIAEECDDGNNDCRDGCDSNCELVANCVDDPDDCFATTLECDESGLGQCVNTPLTGTPCTDDNVCTEGDVCEEGACVPGGPKDCDDQDACTTDTCDSTLGCQYEPVVCSDDDICTDDTNASCDPVSGCIIPPVNCDDSDACTVETCNADNSGCEYVAVDCDDGVECTADTCDPAQGCNHVPDDSACDDDNVCTDDECDLELGCVNTNNEFTQTCYTGPEGTVGVGLCRAGTKTCSAGEFDACEGEVVPVDEICDELDNDCDGEIDEGGVCTVVRPAGEPEEPVFIPVSAGGDGDSACSLNMQNRISITSIAGIIALIMLPLITLGALRRREVLVKPHK